MSGKKVTWLHISDLHYCPSRSGYDADRILRTLQDDLKRLQSSHALAPDLLFFTGDLGFGELAPPGTPFDEQLKGGFAFIESVRRLLRLAKSNVFVIPGNHDVQRSAVAADQVDWLEANRSADDITHLIQGGALQWKRYMDRLSAFRSTLRTAGLPHLLHDKDRLLFAVTRRVRSLDIGVAGLNSAWSSSRDREKGKLWLGGRWQLKDLRERLGPVDVSFALVHHPFNWVTESENEPSLWRLAENEFTFLLHGHEHQDWISVHGRRHARIAAAACYDRSDRVNGYNFGQFDLRSRELQVWLRRYEPDGGGWIPNIVAGRTDRDGKWTERLAEPAATKTLQMGSTIAATSSAPRSAPLKIPRRGYDVFFAVPMATIPPEDYSKHHTDALRVVKAVRAHCNLRRVFYPGEQIKTASEFDPADLAVRRGLVAIAQSRLFMMLYTDAVASSVLVEAGFALALHIPSLYFVKVGVQLPFLLKAAHQAFPDVKVYEFRTIDDVVRHLKMYGADNCEELLRARREAKRAEAFLDVAVR